MIDVDIVTPARKIIDGMKAESVTMPAANGEIMVLPGHTELLTLLKTGVLRFQDHGTERHFAISYGFAEINNDRVLILAETCEESSEIDVERASQAQKRAEEALSSTLSRTEFAKYERKLQRAIIRQQTGK